MKQIPLTELSEIEKTLKKGWQSDVSSMQEHLQFLAVSKARINELLAQWKEVRIKKIESFLETYHQLIPAMKQYEYRDRLNVYCKEEDSFIYRLERISSTIEQQTEALRTIVSFIKEELKNV